MQYIGNILTYFKKELKGMINDHEITSLAYITIENIFGLDKSSSILNTMKEIGYSNRKYIIEIVSELKTGKPIQYILGKADFYGLKFVVSKSVLIPRPETEELVDWIIKSSSNKTDFLDIGTGSGSIIISLCKNLKGEFMGIDISKDALLVANENNTNNNTSVNFRKMDIINENFEKGSFFDVIVSNPPYVLLSELKNMNNNVVDFEPHIALFVDDSEPLFWYKIISIKAKRLLNKDGHLYFEINENYGSEVISILDEEGFVDIELKKDINDKDRMVKAVWK